MVSGGRAMFLEPENPTMKSNIKALVAAEGMHFKWLFGWIKYIILLLAWTGVKFILRSGERCLTYLPLWDLSFYLFANLISFLLLLFDRFTAKTETTHVEVKFSLIPYMLQLIHGGCILERIRKSLHLKSRKANYLKVTVCVHWTLSSVSFLFFYMLYTYSFDTKPYCFSLLECFLPLWHILFLLMNTHAN